VSGRTLGRLIAASALLAVVAVPLGSAQDQFECFDVDVGRCDLAVTANASLPTPDTVRVDATVSNIGPTDSFATTVTVKARSGEWPPFETTIEALPPDGRRPVAADFEIPASARGGRAVFVVAVTPVPGEASVGPNTTEVAIEIPPAEQPKPPDVVPVEVAGRLLDGGAQVEIFGDIRNLGGATAQPVTVTVSAAGFEDEQQTIGSGITEQGTIPFAVALDVPDGLRGTSVRFHVAITPLDGEERTDNNGVDSDPIEIPRGNGGEPGGAHPDLVVPRASARVIETGQRVAVRGEIANRGAATGDDLRLSISAAGWGTETAPLGSGLGKGRTRSFLLRFDVPGDVRGDELSFHVAIDPVTNETNVSNNARNTAAIVLPLVESEEGGDEIPWLLIVAGAAALVVLLSALQLLRGRGPRRERAEATAAGRAARAAEEAVAVRPERTVSTGFASEWAPAHPLDPDMPLAPSTPYLFWLEIGAPVEGSIEQTPTDLPGGLPVGVELTVAVFSLDESLRVMPGADVGELRLSADGSVTVARQAGEVGVPPGSEVDLSRLFFRVHTGEAAGTARLRCNIYFEHVLVQARVITAEVVPDGERLEGAVRSTIDYTLAPRLDPARLAELEPHRLSVLVNESAAGSHDFYFLGDHGFKNSASFDGQELQNLIDRARGALRRAAWGDHDEWADGKAYRYEGFNLQRLETDLVRFALSGYRFYDAIVNRFAGGYENVAALADTMLQPGLVQIASRESPRHVIPAALIYDYPLDTTAPVEEYTLCPTFSEALVQERALGEIPCFRGECPSRDEASVVCASGFWGYRHALGMPVSVAGTGVDVPGEIGYRDGGPRLAVAVSTDPAFILRTRHEQALRALRAGLSVSYADSRAHALSLLKQGGSEVVYFYCHGGVADDIPFIQVGGLTERGITRDLLRSEGIRWTAPRPLVFINGCHTTALEPEKAVEFVSALVENAQASGVIGTEITVFEPLASAFAEECLRRFLGGEPIGEAIRQARLALLAAGNPLGLAYIPFAVAGLRLRAA